MKNKRIAMGILILSMTLFISACTPTNTTEVPSNPPGDSSGKDIEKLEQEIKEKDEKISSLEKMVEELEEKVKEFAKDEEEAVAETKPETKPEIKPQIVYGQEGDILENSVNVLKALKEKDMEKLKYYIHPEKGVRFTPYGYIDKEKDLVVKRNELVDMFKDSKIRNWGDYDGSGFPIEVSLKDYYKEFVYDKDFLNPHMVYINNSESRGNTLNNIKEVYPDGQYIESYFEGFDEEFAGIDWESLRLVFEEYKGKWYLVGIIHSQWTI